VALARRVADGVLLPDGPARPLGVRVAGPASLDIVMGEGRRREVRRLVMALGYGVLDLQRIAFGPLRLDDLPEGCWRALTAGEVRLLQDAARGAPP
jgi:23S rRNA pseudouridine2605 synthase